jgi:uncharacterized membrane protein
MSLSTTSTTWRVTPHCDGIRFGRQTRVGSDAAHPAQWSVEWLLERHGAMVRRRTQRTYALLCALSLAAAALLWWQGATTAMPFGGFEVVAVGAAAFLVARHAADRERIALCGGRLSVEHASGGRVERVAFEPAWVRVEPGCGDRSLIELSGQGSRIAVGRFVRADLRRQLAEELRWALRRWQQCARRVPG